jgi:hypothetical protein
MPIYDRDRNEVQYFAKNGSDTITRMTIYRELENRSAHIPPSICHRLETEFEWKNLSSMNIVVNPAANVMGFMTAVDIAGDHAHGRNTLYFAPGEYDPYSTNGRRVLEERIGQLMTSSSIGPPTRPRSNGIPEQLKVEEMSFDDVNNIPPTRRRS